MNLTRLGIEGVVVGFYIVLVGTIVTYFFGHLTKVELPPVCKDWNKNYAMEVSLFLTGFLGHLFLEVVGINKWYCKNGHACK